MNIALVTLNTKFIHSNLSLWCLKAGVENFCKSEHNVCVFESTINADEIGLLRSIQSFNPDIIAFSCYIWNTEKIISITKIIKQSLSCKIVFGGPEVEYRKEELLEAYPEIDFICSGEGEWSFSSLIDAINGDLSPDECNGISYIKNGKLPEIIQNRITATPPSPYSKEYFDSLNGRISYIEASRGCPFRCSYCLSGRIGGLRYFDFDYVCNNIKQLTDSGTKTIKFIDRTFNADAKKANKILAFIKNNYTLTDKDICFHFEIAADILTDETIKILSEMPDGLCQLEIGIQSFNKKTLDEVNRKCNTEKLVSNIRKLVALKNMHIHIDLIAGLPYEDMESFKESFNKAFSLKTTMLQLGFLKMLHGSEIRDKSDRYDADFSPEAPYEIRKNKWLTKENIMSLKSCEDALERMYNSSRFLLTIDFLLKETGWTPYELFEKFGSSSDFSKISLSDYSERIFDFFRIHVNEDRLREVILCDLNSIDVNIHIPEAIMKYDPEYKTIKKNFTERFHKRVNVVILSSSNQIFIAYPDKKNEITGRFHSEYYTH